MLLLFALSGAAEQIPANIVVGVEHTGYFVSNQFEPAASTSYVVLASQVAFDRMFGVATAMSDQSSRLPPDAFATRMVLAAIHRVKAVVNYQDESLAVEEKTLVFRYTTKWEPRDTAEFACPLIISVPRGSYDDVQFVEDGKTVRHVELQSIQTFTVKCGEADTLTATVEDGVACMTIWGGKGIGKASIQCLADVWPPKMVVRAYLGGLEQLTVAAGRVKLVASVLSHGSHQPLLHVWLEEEEGPPVAKDSPYWMEIQARDATGQLVPAPPPKGGWFEMTIPKVLLADNKTLELEWIDFYR